MNRLPALAVAVAAALTIGSAPATATRVVPHTTATATTNPQMRFELNYLRPDRTFVHRHIFVDARTIDQGIGKAAVAATDPSFEPPGVIGLVTIAFVRVSPVE